MSCLFCRRASMVIEAALFALVVGLNDIGLKWIIAMVVFSICVGLSALYVTYRACGGLPSPLKRADRITQAILSIILAAGSSYVQFVAEAHRASTPLTILYVLGSLAVASITLMLAIYASTVIGHSASNGATKS